MTLWREEPGYQQTWSHGIDMVQMEYQSSTQAIANCLGQVKQSVRQVNLSDVCL